MQTILFIKKVFNKPCKQINSKCVSSIKKLFSLSFDHLNIKSKLSDFILKFFQRKMNKIVSQSHKNNSNIPSLSKNSINIFFKTLINVLCPLAFNEKHYINIRLDMMAANSKLDLTQILSLKRIMANIFKPLRNNPVTNKEMIQICIDISLIDLKIFQHFVSVMFPIFNISADYLQKVFTKTKIYAHYSNKSLSWNDYVAIRSANILAKQPYFKTGLLESHISPYYNINNIKTFTKLLPSESSQQMVETKQPFPDYIFRDGNWFRYFDLKTGKISPMSGHILITSDLEKYNDVSKKILTHQRDCFKKAGEILFYDKLKTILEDNKLSWIERNMEIHDFYENNRTKLPSFLNPSLVYHIAPKYDFRHENYPTRSYNKFTGNTSSCENISETRKLIVENLFGHGKTIVKNYTNSEGACEIIIQNLQNISKEEVD